MLRMLKMICSHHCVPTVAIEDHDDDDDNNHDDDAHMVTMLLCLPAAGETPRNWIWKNEAGIACSGMFCMMMMRRRRRRRKMMIRKMVMMMN